MADILIVDDDPDLTEAIAATISAEGHHVRTARNGREGLAKIYERRPALILLDVEMPALDGPAMIRRLRSAELGGGSIPFVLVSGRAQLAKIAESVGTPYFLRKPFTIDTLLLMLDGALRGPGTPSEGCVSS